MARTKNLAHSAFIYTHAQMLARTHSHTHTPHMSTPRVHTCSLFALIHTHTQTPRIHPFFNSFIRSLSFLFFPYNIISFSFFLSFLFTPLQLLRCFDFGSLFHLAFTLSEFFCLSLLLFSSVLKSDCFLKLGLLNVKTKL